MKFLFTTTTGALLLQTAVLAVEGHYEKLKSTPQHSNDLQRQTQLDRAIASIEGAAASVNISFFAAVAAGPKFTETQIQVQEVAFQLSKLITTFKTSLHSFHITADRVTDTLQTAHGYLAEDMEDFAISSLDQIQSQCLKTKKEWGKLTDDFKLVIPHIQKVVASTELEAKKEFEREEKVRLEKMKVEERLSLEMRRVEEALRARQRLEKDFEEVVNASLLVDKHERGSAPPSSSTSNILPNWLFDLINWLIHVPTFVSEVTSSSGNHTQTNFTTKHVHSGYNIIFYMKHADSIIKNSVASGFTTPKAVATQNFDICLLHGEKTQLQAPLPEKQDLENQKQYLQRSLDIQKRKLREANEAVTQLAQRKQTLKITDNNFYLNKSSGKLKETERFLSDVAQIFQDISVYFKKMEVEMEGIRKNNYGIPKGEEVSGKEKSNKFVAAVGNFFGQWKEFEKSCKNYMDNLSSTQNKISQVLKENPTWEEAKLRLSNGKLKP